MDEMHRPLLSLIAIVLLLAGCASEQGDQEESAPPAATQSEQPAETAAHTPADDQQSTPEAATPFGETESPEVVLLYFTRPELARLRTFGSGGSAGN